MTKLSEFFNAFDRRREKNPLAGTLLGVFRDANELSQTFQKLRSLSLYPVILIEKTPERRTLPWEDTMDQVSPNTINFKLVNYKKNYEEHIHNNVTGYSIRLSSNKLMRWKEE